MRIRRSGDLQSRNSEEGKSSGYNVIGPWEGAAGKRRVQCGHALGKMPIWQLDIQIWGPEHGGIMEAMGTLGPPYVDQISTPQQLVLSHPFSSPISSPSLLSPRKSTNLEVTGKFKGYMSYPPSPSSPTLQEEAGRGEPSRTDTGHTLRDTSSIWARGERSAVSGMWR